MKHEIKHFQLKDKTLCGKPVTPKVKLANGSDDITCKRCRREHDERMSDLATQMGF